MDSTAPVAPAGPAIRDVVCQAQCRIGLGSLARRADVSRDTVLSVLRSGFTDDVAALQRLLAVAEAVVAGNQARS
jgi:hypothetical protein